MKTLWSFLTGKKTATGAAVMLLISLIQRFWPDLLSEEMIEMIKMIAEAIIGVGLAHKAGKAIKK